MPIRQINNKKVRHSTHTTTHTRPSPRPKLHTTNLDRQSTVTVAQSALRVRSPKGMLSRGVQALSGFLSTLSANYFLDIEGKITNEKLVGFLADTLALEQYVIGLYAEIIKRTVDPDIRKQLDHYFSQSKQHAVRIESAIRSLDASPDQTTPWFEFQKKRLDAFFDQSPKDPELQELCDFENLAYAESIDYQCMENLKEALSFIEDSHAKNAVQELIDEVEDEEKEHLSWVKRCLTRATLKWVIQPAEKSQAA